MFRALPWKQGENLKSENPPLNSPDGDRRISPDVPAKDPADDVLGHAPFAKALATSISRMSPSEGYVIALYGPWGSGKTTILNFVKQYLQEESDDAKPIIVDFAPWWFSGQSDLTKRFFDQLAGHLKMAGRGSLKALQSLAEFTEAISAFPIGIPAASGILRSGSKILRAITAARQKDLTWLKERLEHSLQKLKRKIVVVIDDVDRLTADEARQVFGVVKSVANFPNTIYLLAFDRDVVIKALQSLQNVGEGKSTLRK